MGDPPRKCARLVTWALQEWSAEVDAVWGRVANPRAAQEKEATGPLALALARPWPWPWQRSCIVLYEYILYPISCFDLE